MLVGIVLAGGLSQRMGTDKTQLLVPKSNVSLVEHMQLKLKKLATDYIFVSGTKHPNAVPDIVPQCGPLSGIHSVIRHIQLHSIQPTGLLVLPVDMPNLSLDNLAKLVTKGKAAAVPCYYASGFFPLYLPFNDSLITYLAQLFEVKHLSQTADKKPAMYSIYTMLKQLSAKALDCQDSLEFININTPQQWQSYQQNFSKTGQ
ncbi:molybdenum cofactor guanylyltransferase [Paraglaciecola aestuariivivens]